jgi:hypothetical protein
VSGLCAFLSSAIPTSIDFTPSDVVNAVWLTQQLSVKFLDRLDEIEAEAADSVGMTAAARVVAAMLERADYSTAEHRSFKARHG